MIGEKDKFAIPKFWTYIFLCVLNIWIFNSINSKFYQALIYTEYFIFQEEKSIFWEVIISVHISKKVSYKQKRWKYLLYRDRAVWMYSYKIVNKKDITCYLYIYVQVTYGPSIHTKSGYTRQIAKSHRRYYYLHKITSKWTQMSYPPFSYLSCKAHWC